MLKPLNLFSFVVIGILLMFNQAHAQFYKGMFKVKPSSATENTYTIPSTLSAAVLNEYKNDLNLFSKFIFDQNHEQTERNLTSTLQKRMAQELLLPYKKVFIQSFFYTSGRRLAASSRIKMNNRFVFVPEDGYPMPFSATGVFEDYVMPNFYETYGTWLEPLYKNSQEAQDKHFDWEQAIYKLALRAQKRGASALLVYENYESSRFLQYNSELEWEILNIPVVFIRKKTYDTFILNAKEMVAFQWIIQYEDQKQSAFNVNGFVNNNAEQNILIYTPFVLYPEDNSKAAHANEHGIATLLALSKVLRNAPFNKYNYILSGMSQTRGLTTGLQYFFSDLGFKSYEVKAAIGLGNFANWRQEGLVLGGMNSSPTWNDYAKTIPFQIQKPSNSHFVGNEDIAAKKIPYLSFNNPKGVFSSKRIDSETQDALEILNFLYHILAQIEEKGSPVFYLSKDKDFNDSASKTGISHHEEEVMGMTFQRDFEGIGAMVKSIQANSPFFVAGVRTGDVFIQIDEKKFNNAFELKPILQALTKGKSIKVKAKRGSALKIFEVLP